MRKLFLISVLALLPSFAHASIAFRTDCTPKNQSSSVASFTVSCPSTTSGDMLLIVGAEYNSSGGTITVACTDTQGNTFTTLQAANAVFYCYALNIVGGADTVTVTFTGGTSFSVTLGGGFSGVGGVRTCATPGSSAACNINNSIASCTACNMPTISVVGAGDLVLTAGGNATVNNTFSAGTGFTISANGQVSGGNQSGAVEYQITSGTGSLTPVLNITTAMAITGYTVSFFPAAASTNVPQIGGFLVGP